MLRANGRILSVRLLGVIVGAVLCLVPDVAVAASPKKLRVRLLVSASGSTGSSRLTVSIGTAARAHCALSVSARKEHSRFPAVIADRRGFAVWSWQVPARAPSGHWAFAAVCTSRRRVGRATSRQVILTLAGARSGPLVSPSTGAESGLGSAANSCNSQGQCFSADPFYNYPGQCTWYAAGRRPDLNGIVHGNAGDWLNEASGHVPEGNVPVVGAIAVWLPNHGPAGEYGHVAYVAAISGGTIIVDDSNWAPSWNGPWLLVHEHAEPASAVSGYIYGGPAGNGPTSSPSPTAGPTTPTPTPTTPTPTPTPAPAPPPQYWAYHVYGTCADGACGLKERAGPGFTNYAQVGSVSDGNEIDIVCQTMGQTVTGTSGASSGVWDKLTNGSFVSDYYVDTPNVGSFSPPIPQC